MASVKHISLSLIYGLVFGISGFLSGFAHVSAYVFPEHSFEISALILVIPVIIILSYECFKIGYEGKWSGSIFPFIIGVIVLPLFLFPTPVKFFYTASILWGSTAAFLVCLFPVRLRQYMHFGKWCLAICLPWVISYVIGEAGPRVLSTFWVQFPQEVELGYNLYFLSGTLSILAILIIYQIRPTIRHAILLFSIIAIGSFVGYLISIPLIKILLSFFDNDVHAFIVAIAVQAACHNFWGGVFAGLGLAIFKTRRLEGQSE